MVEAEPPPTWRDQISSPVVSYLATNISREAVAFKVMAASSLVEP